MHFCKHLGLNWLLFKRSCTFRKDATRVPARCLFLIYPHCNLHIFLQFPCYLLNTKKKTQTHNQTTPNQNTLSTITPGWKRLHIQFSRHKHACGFFSYKWTYVCFSQVWAESSLKCVLPSYSAWSAENFMLERHLCTCRSLSGKDTCT